MVRNNYFRNRNVRGQKLRGQKLPRAENFANNALRTVSKNNVTNSERNALWESVCIIMFTSVIAA